jgi:hypothetical protein
MSALKEIAIVGGMVAGGVALAFGLAAGIGHSQYGTPEQQSLHQRSAESAVTAAGFTNPHVEKYDGGYCNKYSKITHKFSATNAAGGETTAFVCQSPDGMASIVYPPPRAK